MASVYTESKIFDKIRTYAACCGHNFHGITSIKRLMVRYVTRHDPTESFTPLNFASVEMGLLKLMNQELVDRVTDVTVRGVQFYMKVDKPNQMGFRYANSGPDLEGWETDLQVGRYDSIHLLNRDLQVVIHARVSFTGKVATLRIMGRDGFMFEMIQRALTFYFGRNLSANEQHYAVVAISFGLPVKVGLPNIVFEGGVQGAQVLQLNGVDIQLKVTKLLERAVVNNRELRAVQELKLACGASAGLDMRYSSGFCKTETRFFANALCEWFQLPNPFTTSSSLNYGQSHEEEVDLFRDERNVNIPRHVFVDDEASSSSSSSMSVDSDDDHADDDHAIDDDAVDDDDIDDEVMILSESVTNH